MSVYVAKTPQHSVRPLDYRALALLSSVYRTWARIRLRQINPWVKSWAHQGLHAGIPGLGAQDA
eukprot:1754670-Alexandrium_andersonii.AAC.1